MSKKKNKYKRADNQPLSAWERAQEERKKVREKKTVETFSHDFLKQFPKISVKRTKKLQKSVATLLLVYGLIFLVSLLFVLPITRIMSVQVRGADAQVSKSVIKASNLRYYQSLWATYPHTNRIVNRVINDVPSVKKAQLVYNGTHIIIHVKEYPTVGYIYQNGKYYKLSNQGIANENGYDNIKGSYPIFYNFKNMNDLQLLVKQMNKLPYKIRRDISEVKSTPDKLDEQKITLYMNDGNQVIITIKNFAEKMAYYPGIVANMNYKGIVDLQVGAYSYPYKEHKK